MLNSEFATFSPIQLIFSSVFEGQYFILFFRRSCQPFCAIGLIMRLNGPSWPSYLEEGSIVAMARPLRHPCCLGHVSGLDRYLSFRLSLEIPTPWIMLSLLLFGLETSQTSIHSHESAQVRRLNRLRIDALVCSVYFC